MGDVSRRAVLGGAGGAAALAAVPVDAGADPRRPGTIRPVRLTAEHLVNPLGIDAAQPRLGWQLDAGGTGRAQTGYRILVAADPAALAEGQPDVWDSGRVPSAEQSALRYAGPPLRSATRYHWAVQVWDESGRPTTLASLAYLASPATSLAPRARAAITVPAATSTMSLNTYWASRVGAVGTSSA